MNPRLTHLLVRLYPRAWRERYGAEFEALLQTSRGGLWASAKVAANVVWSAVRERAFPTRGGTMNQHPPSQFASWCVRAPWAMFGIAPILILAGAYFVACFILWSGWRIFLPAENTPFVAIDGFAIFYFGVGRLLYYSAPILIGWGVSLIAARQGLKVAWPIVGLAMIALIGGTAQVRPGRPVPGGGGHISMNFALGHSVQDISSGLLHAVIIFSLTALPYLVWRFRKAHSVSA